jgi:hypothetical protein
VLSLDMLDGKLTLHSVLVDGLGGEERDWNPTLGFVFADKTLLLRTPRPESAVTSSFLRFLESTPS